MYCASVFCLFRKYSPISLNSASCIAVSSGIYSQLPSTLRFGYLPVIRLSTLFLNPLRDRPMRGVIYHVYDPKISTSFKTAFKKTPDTFGLAPSLPSNLVSQAQIFWPFLRFPLYFI